MLTRASWLNQVEVWVSILEGEPLRGASFNSVKELREHVDAFIKAYNKNLIPTDFIHDSRAMPGSRQIKSGHDERVSRGQFFRPLV